MNTTEKDPKLKALLAESEALIQEASAYLDSQGKRYSLSEWVTLKKYAELHQLRSISIISNWIERGIVPKSDLVIIEELNDLKLIRNKVYKA